MHRSATRIHCSWYSLKASNRKYLYVKYMMAVKELENSTWTVNNLIFRIFQYWRFIWCSRYLADHEVRNLTRSTSRRLWWALKFYEHLENLNRKSFSCCTKEKSKLRFPLWGAISSKLHIAAVLTGFNVFARTCAGIRYPKITSLGYDCSYHNIDYIYISFQGLYFWKRVFSS